MSFTTSFGQQQSDVILEDFESLGLLSRNCFDLLVKIIVRALACGRIFQSESFVYDEPWMGFFGVTLRIVLCPIMRGAPCSMSQRHLDRQDRAPCPLPAISCLGQRSGRATAATIAKRFSAMERNGRSRRTEVTVVLPACRQHKSSERQG